MQNYTVFDIETNGLIETVSKIHCLSYQKYVGNELIQSGTITTTNGIRQFLEENPVLVGHNIIRYDIPVLEKLLGNKITSRLIDTLALSWYLYPMKPRHGLEAWGDDLGVKKPEILDWENLRLEDYVNRCETDVVINNLLFEKQLTYLGMVYDYDSVKMDNLINYLGFKLDCAKEQEEVGCKVNRELVNSSLEELRTLKTEKVNALIASMPKYRTYKEVKRPAKLTKADGTISQAGIKWSNLLLEQGLPENYDKVVTVLKSEENGNPSSTTQMKAWLDGLGWVPRNFEHRKNKAGEVKAIPQIYVSDQVCDSIKDLYTLEPALENLDMLSLINHRIGVFESMLYKMNEEDVVRAEVNGFTNTLRFKHRKPIVNLPKVFKFYGKQIRGSIIAPTDNHLLCGSDMSSLEDTTKQHYMYFFDPEYVSQMRVPGFDPHIDIGVLAKLLKQEESDFFKWYNKTKKDVKDGLSNHIFTEAEHAKIEYITQIRNKAKTVNFAGVYGAGPPKIALTTGMPLQQAQKLHKTYWDRNKSVKQVAASARTKTTTFDGVEQMWLYNPVSGFWYTLRYEKDKFSTLNQGTG